MKKPHFVSKIPTHSRKDTTTQDYQDAYYVLTLDSMAKEPSKSSARSLPWRSSGIL